MKKILITGMFAATVLFSTNSFAQEKSTNDGAATETVVTTIEVNNGDGIKELKKEVTTKTEQALMLNEDDKNKLNQDYKMGPTKTTKTTIIKDGDKVVSKEQEVYYTKGDTKYVLESSEENISYNAAKTADSSKKKYQIKTSNGQKCTGYFNEDGDFCEEMYNKDAGTMKQNIYKKSE
ncbi:hypothetical protein SAMN05216480_1167 [Pustulibacterium marinum]|uniref:MORN repeat variant n=1 Tax=Pustulibacterium marinum TaxID=1224947 RepID=A0A1I7IFW7_9FLAO|nr:hypothetical protein [Pustulibacterium marinum]SFU71844.1 hypothetical protein SAMN05216480_1167 [Pustulibacterium marinum]